MALYLFAGIPVADFTAALTWYEKLLGAPPDSFPQEAEAVWQLAQERLIYIIQRPEHAGHGMLTVIVDDLDERVDAASLRGVEPAKSETYDNGVRKITYSDPDGNEIGFGQVPG
ncbi:VOC family protein [Nocardia miyunensis]|uniref:VOC family protein n=1 Tax=Nocardia miyunensis TaxID=282684 RepID=UPI00082EF30D|nr:VOC family protein [Nocardia miyunensis]